MEFPDHPFWDFSLDVYGRPQVAPACLALQGRHGVDVNFLLFCCWLGHAGHGALGDDGIARLHAAVAPWHRDVVRPLRAVRQRLKSEVPGTAESWRLGLRKRLAALELEAEHVEQLTLAAALGDAMPPEVPPEQAAAAAAANLAAYFAEIGVDLDGADRDRLELVLGAAFPALAPDRLAELRGGLGE